MIHFVWNEPTNNESVVMVQWVMQKWWVWCAESWTMDPLWRIFLSYFDDIFLWLNDFSLFFSPSSSLTLSLDGAKDIPPKLIAHVIELFSQLNDNWLCFGSTCLFLSHLQFWNHRCEIFSRFWLTGLLFVNIFGHSFCAALNNWKKIESPYFSWMDIPWKS